MYFIIGVIVKFLLQQLFAAVLNMSSSGHVASRTEAVVYVVRRRSL